MLKNKWFILLILSLIWGSSFILIKKSLIGLTPLQMGSLRILFTSIILLSTGWKDLRRLSAQDWKWLAITGYVGTFFPVYLFAFAQTHTASSVAALLNSLTPFNTFLISAIVFGRQFRRLQIGGILLGILGSVILITASEGLSIDKQWQWSMLILLASVGYGLNANFLKQYLSHLPALTVTKSNFVTIMFPALLVLIFAGFPHPQSDSLALRSMGFVFLLSLLGTAFAKVLFNQLIKISSALFSSLVTYTMPVIAIMWGILDHERVSLFQILGGAIIILGIYLVGKFAPDRRI